MKENLQSAYCSLYFGQQEQCAPKHVPCSDWWVYKTREAQIGKQRLKLRTVASNHNLWMLRNYIKRCNETALSNHLANGERKHPALFEQDF